jgi:hypothetical protein
MTRASITGRWLVAMVLAGALAPATVQAALPEINGPTSDEGPLASKSLTIKTVGGKVIKCKSTEESAGGASAPKKVGMLLVLRGCAMAGNPCHMTGLGAGEMVWDITGDLGYVNKAKRQVGADLEGSPPVIAAFECGGERMDVVGSVIARITPLNTPTSTLKFKLSESAGVQKIKSLEGLSPNFPTTMFGAGGEEESGISLTATVTLHTPVTITA